MLAQRRYIVCVCMRPRNAASIWIGDSFKRLCSWWWTNYFGRCELWQNWHLKTRKWRGRILFGFLRRDSIVLYGFISCSWVTLTNHTTSCSWYPQAAGLIWRGNKKRLMASKIIAQTHRSFQRQRLPLFFVTGCLEVKWIYHWGIATFMKDNQAWPMQVTCINLALICLHVSRLPLPTSKTLTFMK